jgi:hypothetical protein
VDDGLIRQGSHDAAPLETIKPEDLKGMSPFGDAPVVSVICDKHIEVGQLADEISAEAGKLVSLALVNTTIPDDDEHGTLFVTPPVEVSLVKRLMQAHRPDDMHGFSPAQRQRLELTTKLKSGEELSQEDMRAALALALSSQG